MSTWYPRIEDIPEGQVYDLLVADPPWKFLTRSDKGKLKKSAECHYRTMTLEEIKALPIARLAAPNCALMLWGTAPMIVQQLEVMAAWGFVYKSQGMWHKLTKSGKTSFGTGFRIRNSHEPFIIGVRGNPKNTKAERSVIMAKTREHSRKPEEFYRMAERWMPGARRLDIFGRELRPGWDVMGDEGDKFEAAA